MKTEDLQNAARQAVQLAQKQGADTAEAYVVSSRELEIDVREQRVETLKQAQDRGLGLRIVRNKRQGFAYTTDFAPQALLEVVQKAIANAAGAQEDPCNVLPQAPKTAYAQLSLYDAEIERHSVDDKIALARQIEQSAREQSPRISNIESSSYFDAAYQVVLVNSSGIDAAYAGNYCGAAISLVAAEGGSSQQGFAVAYALGYKQLEPRQLGVAAAQKALRMLGAQETATRRTTVVFDAYTAVRLLGLLVPALTAEAVQKGRSLLAGKIGTRVASELVTIIDDGQLPGGLNSAPFDDEGVPCARTVLIADGVLQTYLYNTYTACKDGTASTGNGMRGSFKGAPGTGISNFYLQPGDISVEQLLADIGDGIYVTELLGMHTADPISGDLSVGVSGLLIADGCLSTPVKGIALAGNLFEIMEKVEAVADDLQFFGGIGSPTMRVGSLVLSGS